MLEDVSGRFQATCDKCGALETVDTTTREVAVLRLIRAGWHLVTTGETFCSGCHQTPTMRRRRFGS
jgi:hypothetical protein